MTGGLLILGCGGHGRVVADIALDCGYAGIAFLDDSPDAAVRVAPFPVLGPFSRMTEFTPDWGAAVAAIGDNAARLALYHRLRQAGFETPAIVHPSAIISRNAQIAAGVVVAPGAVINVGVRVGEASIVNTGARIDHDCVIGAGSHIAPGATLSGGVTLGERVWLGTGSAVRQGVAIGDDAFVGVGAAVVSDLVGARTYVGVPARLLPKQA